MGSRTKPFKKELTMPKVGSKHFAYDTKGVAKAQAYAKKTGAKMETGKKKAPPKKGR